MSEKKKSNGLAFVLYFDAVHWCREKVMETAELYNRYAGRDYEVTKTTHHICIGEACALIDSMPNSVTDPEFYSDYLDAVNYLRVCYDCIKHKLDFKRARKDFRINELIRKYM